jgi:hypothetical protein
MAPLPSQPPQAWVRGVEADGRNLAEISMIYEGQIRGVCLSRSGSRGRLFDGEDVIGAKPRARCNGVLPRADDQVGYTIRMLVPIRRGAAVP